MTELTDKMGASVNVEPDRTGSSFVIKLADDNTVTGHAYYIDHDGDRIFFHTVVDEAYSGRGLAGIVVKQALEHTAREGLTVVPVCPVVKGYLDNHGDDYTSQGGIFRAVTTSDLDIVRQRTEGQ